MAKKKIIDIFTYMGISRYAQLQREHQISPGDFPDIKKMQEQLANQDFTKFHPLDKKLLERVDKMLAEDIAKLMVLLMILHQ